MHTGVEMRVMLFGDMSLNREKNYSKNPLFQQKSHDFRGFFVYSVNLYSKKNNDKAIAN